MYRGPSNARPLHVTSKEKYYGFYSDVGRRLDIPYHQVYFMFGRLDTPGYDALSMECVPYDELEFHYYDTTFDKIFCQERRRKLTAVVSTLDRRNVEILSMYYGLCAYDVHTLEEVGKKLNLCRERVRIIRDQAMRKLFKNPKTRLPMSELVGIYPEPVKKKKLNPYLKVRG